MSEVEDGPRPRIAVVVFPGSNDDRDAQREPWTRLGAEARLVWHTETAFPPRTRAVVLPGGFSYGDYLRAGAIARFSPIMTAVVRFAGEGGLVLGVCNGFQILTEARMLPGVLRPNAALSFVCRDVRLRVERTDTPFTTRCDPPGHSTIPVKHGDGCWYAATTNSSAKNSKPIASSSFATSRPTIPTARSPMWRACSTRAETSLA